VRINVVQGIDFVLVETLAQLFRHPLNSVCKTTVLQSPRNARRWEEKEEKDGEVKKNCDAVWTRPRHSKDMLTRDRNVCC